jgi:glucosylceramidase
MHCVQDTFPEVEMYWTEGGPDYTLSTYPTEWTRWGTIFTDVLRNHRRSLTVWNLATNEQGYLYLARGGLGFGGATTH